MKLLPRILLLTLLLSFTASLALAPARAQSPDPLWSEPANLSQSGAASQPRLLAAPDGSLQAFWWDRFDGLMSAVYDDSAWGAPFSMELPGAGATPELLLDPAANVHALWLEGGPGGALLHASTPFGQALWSTPAVLADSALAFRAVLQPDGSLAAAYLRGVADEMGAAGVYALRRPAGQTGWEAAIAIHTSAYYRLLAAEQAWLWLAADETGTFIAWEEAQSGAAFYAASTDGVTWGSAQPVSHEFIDSQGLAPARPRLAAQPDGAPLLIWQDASRSACALYQQAWVPAQGESGGWGAPQAILSALNACPAGGEFQQQAGRLYWLWGMGAGEVTLAAWDAAQGAWSTPQALTTDLPGSDGEALRLGEPALAFDETGIYLTGTSEAGDAWFARAQAGAVDLAYPPASPWLIPPLLSTAGLAAADPALAIDAQNRIHAVWSEGIPGGPAAQLLYARAAGEQANALSISRPTAIVSAAAGEIARQPALLEDGTWLHLAWSGGSGGEILYSRAALDQAASAAAWSPVQYLSDGLPAAWPQLAADPAGRLYLLYVLPINEGRGVYLVRSQDAGQTWSDPERIFDAAAAGWEMVGRPALALTPSLHLAGQVEVHAAWIQESQPGALPSLGIYYARAAASLSDFEPLAWSEPFQAAAGTYSAPRLAAAAGALQLFSVDGDGALWQRALPLDAPFDDVGAWGTPSRVSGWVNLSGWTGLPSAGMPYGLAAAGSPLDGGLYLAGPAYAINTDPAFILRFSAWQDGRWASIEAYDPAGLPAGEILAAAAAARPEGGRLALAWVSLDEAGLPALRLAWRPLPEFALPPLPTPLPTSTPAPQPTLAPTLAPTPTPDLNRTPPASAALPDPRLLGGGLAALMVVGVIVVVRLGWFRKPS